MAFKYTKHWEDGNLKWGKKKVQDRPQKSINDLSFDNVLSMTLISCDLKSDVVGESWKIERNGTTIKHFFIDETTSWEISENVITLMPEDDMNFDLIFMNINEAMKADYRLYLIMNGQLINDCGDENYYRCGNMTELNVVFN